MTNPTHAECGGRVRFVDLFFDRRRPACRKCNVFIPSSEVRWSLRPDEIDATEAK